jgi:hypothetical protein
VRACREKERRGAAGFGLDRRGRELLDGLLKEVGGLAQSCAFGLGLSNPIQTKSKENKHIKQSSFLIIFLLESRNQNTPPSSFLKNGGSKLLFTMVCLCLYSTADKTRLQIHTESGSPQCGPAAGSAWDTFRTVLIASPQLVGPPDTASRASFTDTSMLLVVGSSVSEMGAHRASRRLVSVYSQADRLPP